LTLPVMPMAVRVAPGIGCGVSVMERMVSTTASICSAVAWLFMTTSMATPLWRRPYRDVIKEFTTEAQRTQRRHPGGNDHARSAPGLRPFFLLLSSLCPLCLCGSILRRRAALLPGQDEATRLARRRRQGARHHQGRGLAPAPRTHPGQHAAR